MLWIAGPVVERAPIGCPAFSCTPCAAHEDGAGQVVGAGHVIGLVAVFQAEFSVSAWQGLEPLADGLHAFGILGR